ncbi:hypothetical protein [Streptomyces sp. NPDC056160]|uniref:hypothetical protein n=1 Tax=Streptomyces sp. NPDC056160 TaxID=3345731 RepID=UPI0035E1A163
MFRRAFRRAALVTAATAVTGLGLTGVATAAPAGAQSCAKTYHYGATEVQIDNCPGDGAPSWFWIHTKTSGSNYSATAWMTLANGSRVTLDVAVNHSTAHEWDADIRSLEICEYYTIGWAPPIPLHRCSGEHGV